MFYIIIITAEQNKSEGTIIITIILIIASCLCGEPFEQAFCFFRDA